MVLTSEALGKVYQLVTWTSDCCSVYKPNHARTCLQRVLCFVLFNCLHQGRKTDKQNAKRRVILPTTMPEFVEIWYTCWRNNDYRRPRNCENPLPVKYKMADGVQIRHIEIAIIPLRIVWFCSNSFKVWSHRGQYTKNVQGQRVKGQSHSVI